MFIQRYFNHIGLVKNEPQDVTVKTFTPAVDKDTAILYLDYLKELDHNQRDRGTTIENKNSLMIGQASIVTSIFALFIPLLVDKFNEINIYLLVGLSVIFLVVLGHYLLSIFHAIQTLLIDKYPYKTRSVITITKEDRANDELSFLNTEISDLVTSLDHNREMNDRKGGNLILAARCFQIANFGFAILTLLIIISAFFMRHEKDPNEIRVTNFDDLKFITTDTTKTKVTNMPTMDTLNLQFDSTGSAKVFKDK
ncbi:MAG: hypothetical protein KDD36_12155 [Flavobacteriales bacterium]|nr:hypothetical protein [Flavobacteriales bacterium]